MFWVEESVAEKLNLSVQERLGMSGYIHPPDIDISSVKKRIVSFLNFAILD